MHVGKTKQFLIILLKGKHPDNITKKNICWKEEVTTMRIILI